MAKVSWAVLREQPSLTVFPVISTIAAVGMSAVLAVAATVGADAAASAGLSDQTMKGLGYLALFLWYFLTTFVVVFCNAALIFCALQKFAGGQVSVGSGFSSAGRRLPQILGWTLLASTVGVVLQLLQSLLKDKIGILGDLAGGLTQGFWGVATYFAVPVVVTEGLGPIAAVKRSSALLRRTWGESLSGTAGLGIVMFLFLLPVFIIAVPLLFVASSSMAMAAIGSLCAVYVVTLVVVFTALGSIFRAGVYSYATTGATPVQMDTQLLQSAFRHAS